MSRHHEHHFPNLRRARDHLSDTVRQPAVRGRPDDRRRLDRRQAVANDITGDAGPRLARLRTAASERFDEHSRHADVESMRSGEMPFPNERRPATMLHPVLPAPRVALEPPVELDAPKAKIGAELVAKHGGIYQAMMAYEPDSRENRSHPGLSVHEQRQAAEGLDPAHRRSRRVAPASPRPVPPGPLGPRELRQRRRQRRHRRPRVPRPRRQGGDDVRLVPRHSLPSRRTIRRAG